MKETQKGSLEQAGGTALSGVGKRQPEGGCPLFVTEMLNNFEQVQDIGEQGVHTFFGPTG